MLIKFQEITNSSEFKQVISLYIIFSFIVDRDWKTTNSSGFKLVMSLRVIFSEVDKN